MYVFWHYEVKKVSAHKGDYLVKGYTLRLNPFKAAIARFSLIAVAALFLCAMNSSASGSIISIDDSSFETGLVLYPASGSGWLSNGSGNFVATSSAFASATPTVPDGAKALWINNAATVWQDLIGNSLSAGTYTLTVWLGQHPIWMARATVRLPAILTCWREALR